MPGVETIRAEATQGYPAITASENSRVVTDGDHLGHLRQQRAATWELIRGSVPDLARILELWDSMIAQAEGRALPIEPPVLSHAEAGPYSRYENAADALVAYISEQGPKPRLEVMHAVVAGGWAHEDPDAMGLMRDAMYYQLKRATRPKVKVRKGDILDLA